MIKNKKSWLTGLLEAEQKAQQRLELENDQPTEVVFERIKPRVQKLTTEERMLISILRISGFFIVQIFLLGWFIYAGSGALEGWDALGTSLTLILMLSILTVVMIVMCIYTLSKCPKSYFLYFVLLFNCVLAFYILSVLG